MSGLLIANALLVALAAVLLWAAYWDVRTFNISNELNATIAVGALLFWWASGVDVWPDAAMRVGVSAAVFVGLAAAFYVGMMGGGDVKMAAALVLWFPAGRIGDFLIIMSLAGGVVTLAAIVKFRMRKRAEGSDAKPEVPYGVAIAFAGLWLIAERYFYQFS